jgi:hypothetical protein
MYGDEGGSEFRLLGDEMTPATSGVKIVNAL